jgi:CelD/BcsL family acetyltransferase involved in cellulose biosynthesis
MAEWAVLFACHGRDPFQNPRWYQAWWDNVGERDGWQPHVATGRVEGQLTAVAPLAVSRSMGIRKLEWAGTQFFDYPDVLAADDADIRHFWNAIRRIGRFDIARLRDVRFDGHSSPVLDSMAGATGPGSPVYEIKLSHSSGAEWLESLSTRMRANQRANIRQIEKQGPLTLTLASDPDAVTRSMDILLDLKSAWAKTRETGDGIARPDVQNLMRRLAIESLHDGSLHLSSLKCGDHTIAINLGFIRRGSFYYYLPAYDAAFAKMSPGRVHLMMLISSAIDRGLRRFDFLRGEDPYKVQFGKPARTLHDYTFSRGLIGGLAARLHGAMNRRSAEQPIAVAAE